LAGVTIYSEKQKLFAFLSVFSGSFTLQAAEVIFSQAVTEKSISDLVTSLLAKSLLQQVSDERVGSRFTILVAIQRFALNQLRTIDLETTARHDHSHRPSLREYRLHQVLGKLCIKLRTSESLLFMTFRPLVDFA